MTLTTKGWFAPSLFFFLVLISTSVLMAENNHDAMSATYDSEISKENNAQFFASIKNRKINKLRVNSSGGEVDAAITLALWIHKNKINIEVLEYCLSSCANYLFLAANHKHILPGAVVAWHGNYHHLKETGLWKDDIVIRMKRTRESRVQAKARVLQQVNYLVQREQEFFKKIGIDEKICWVGKVSPYNAINYYFLSVADMHRFGVENITASMDYDKTSVNAFNEHIEYLKLK